MKRDRWKDHEFKKGSFHSKDFIDYAKDCKYDLIEGNSSLGWLIYEFNTTNFGWNAILINKKKKIKITEESVKEGIQEKLLVEFIHNNKESYLTYDEIFNYLRYGKD